MTECEICGREVSGGSLFTCTYCHGSFCPDHRLPFNHSCPNIAEWRRSDTTRRTKKKAEVISPIKEKQYILAGIAILLVLVVLFVVFIL